MEQINLYWFITLFGSLSLGAFIGILTEKLSGNKNNSLWVFAFYGLGIVTFVLPIVFLFKKWSTATIGEIIVAFVCIAAAILVIIITKVMLHVKNIYTTSELHPIVNAFTEFADKKEIKLFGGDFDFLGNTSEEIDAHPQYTALKKCKFGKVLILCAAPNGNDAASRYGKILMELKGSELRFYRPERADLAVRGRIVKRNGVDQLLMYSKKGPGIYEAIEADIADPNGMLILNIWELTWSLAITPLDEQIQSYKEAFLKR